MVCSVQIVDVPNRIKRMTTRRRLEDSSCDSAADGGAGVECVIADDSIAVADADNSVM